MEKKQKFNQPQQASFIIPGIDLLHFRLSYIIQDKACLRINYNFLDDVADDDLSVIACNINVDLAPGCTMY